MKISFFFKCREGHSYSLVLHKNLLKFPLLGNVMIFTPGNSFTPEELGNSQTAAPFLAQIDILSMSTFS